MLVLGFAAGCSESRESTATSVAGADGVVPVGFEQTAMTVTNADGTVCVLCVWLADEGKRAQGLMGVTDLGGKDGMIFVYDEPVTNQFWMRNTPTSLDIAWFDVNGAFVSSATMEPCLTGPDEECTRYAAEAPFLMALEVFAGDLAQLGIGPGSVAVLDAGSGCEGA